MFEIDFEEAQEKLAALSQKFSPADVKQRSQNGMTLDYISIDATIRRLNEVMGPAWSFEVDRSSIAATGTVGKKSGKPEYLAHVVGTLTAMGESHGGVGADISEDPDKALKTALAEALKKAGHQLGIGLYLWDEAERDHLHVQRRAESGDVDALKALVTFRAKQEGCAEMTAEGIAAHFDISTEELQDPELLRKLAGV